MAAAALVLGGLSALVLAIVVASKEPSRSRARALGNSSAAAGEAAIAPEEVEYQLDADEPEGSR